MLRPPTRLEAARRGDTSSSPRALWECPPSHRRRLHLRLRRRLALLTFVCGGVRVVGRCCLLMAVGSVTKGDPATRAARWSIDQRTKVGFWASDMDNRKAEQVY